MKKYIEIIWISLTFLCDFRLLKYGTLAMLDSHKRLRKERKANV